MDNNNNIMLASDSNSLFSWNINLTGRLLKKEDFIFISFKSLI